jgi:AcrR family transcriptional regulator
MGELGMRERKKAQTRARIAAAAARLFAVRGYDEVTVLDVAQEADVSEKTVYNHFPTKESLALDRDEEELDRLVALLRTRPRRASPASAIRRDALDLVDSIAHLPADEVLGTIGPLASANPEIRRACLDMFDRHARILADELLAEVPGRVSAVHRARVRAYAGRLVWIYMAIIDEAGALLARGVAPRAAARRVRPVIAGLIDDLERGGLPRATAAAARRRA